MRDRYEDKNELIDHRMGELSSMTSNSTLRQLVDDFSNHVRSLKSLGKRELGQNTHTPTGDKILERVKSEDGAQSNSAHHRKILKDLQSFIEHRCKYLARVIPGVAAVSGSNKPSNQGSRSKTVALANLVCSLCSSNHTLAWCKQLINDHIARIKKLKICFNYFLTRHRAKMYSSNSACRQCKEKYYILIHVAKKMPRTGRSVCECLPQISCSACNDDTERVMLSTAIVHLLE